MCLFWMMGCEQCCRQVYYFVGIVSVKYLEVEKSALREAIWNRPLQLAALRFS